MSETRIGQNDFIARATEIVEDNLSNVQFGVTELADATHMSRSNLLRKIKKLTGLSVSQFIRKIRLENAMELLKEGNTTISEISYQVGFNSTSYFIKCFREEYGYPPGQAGKQEDDEDKEALEDTSKKRPWIYIGSLIAVAVLVLVAIVFKPFSGLDERDEKSIAVLPFIDDSSDSTNVYIINGLMESILNNLQKVEDLRVISRTSVEKYRSHDKTIPEIAKELGVRYFVEGSGQKIGNQLLLTVQLIDSKEDKHMWSEQYHREAKDIFQLQTDVAKSIADQVQAIITPEEKERIEKIPTKNLVAYDYFLKGMEYLRKETPEGLINAIPLFKKAIAEDNEFAMAYANLAVAYFFMDIYQADKKYTQEISDNADKALFYDPQLSQSLVAKALYYIYTASYMQAVPYLEKAIEIHPNSSFAINILTDFYTNVIPNTDKYLEYALKGLSLGAADQDSLSLSYTYLHLGNAFIQTGFIDEALHSIDVSLKYNPDNLYSELVKAYVLYAQNEDLEKTSRLIVDAWKRDTTRLDLMLEAGKTFYYMRDYEKAFTYLNRFDEERANQNLQIFLAEDGKIGETYYQLGKTELANKLFTEYKTYADNDQSIYKNLSLAMYYSHMGKKQQAIEHLKLFVQQDNFQFWIILFLEMDPLVDPIKDLPEFKEIMNELRTKFWQHHDELQKTLKEKKLI